MTPLALSFASPWWLLALLLVPLALVLYARDQQHRQAQRDAFADPRTAVSALGAGLGARRHVPVALYLLAAALLAVALAKPQTTVAVDDEEATVVLVTDRSGSMQATDVPPDRLTVAQRAAYRFLDRLPRKVKAASVAFNQRAEVLSAPTTDRQELRDGFAGLTPAGGTATGDALDTALRLVRPRDTARDAPPAAIILLSDGASVRGKDPVDVARRAAQLDVPVYAVALGTPTGTITVPRPGGRGGTETREVPPDVETLQQITRLTNGRAYEARDAQRLDAVYEELGSKVGKKDVEREVTAGAVGIAVLLLVAGGGLSLGLLGRLP